MSGTTEGAYKAWETKRAGGAVAEESSSRFLDRQDKLDGSTSPQFSKVEKEFSRESDRVFDHVQSAASPITQDHLTAYNKYVDHSYKTVNKDLWNSSPSTPPTNPLARKVQDLAMGMPPTTKDTVVYRFTGGAELAGLGEGSEFQVAGFLSSTSHPAAMSGAWQGSSTNPKVGIEIFVPEGSPGVIRGFNKAELEYTFPHGARFRLEKKLGPSTGRYGKSKVSHREVYQLRYLGPN
jgi:hypothetical protein